ncbi:MAG: metal ABC transporter substrate-binding protein [Akkermansiaceae bacterium]|nr:metal ABC transporter substrate-binding protein [Akkermansiaceae bacterium]
MKKMKHSKILLTIAALAACAFSTACSKKSGGGPNKPLVVTTFTILADMAQEVAGDAAQVVSITQPGAEIHGYEPTPQDLVKAQGADLILWNGLNLEMWFERFFQSLDDVPSATLSEGVDPISIASGPYNGKPNPHAWMAPKNAAIYVENIRKALVDIDPDNAETYNANAKAYTEKLLALDEPVREKLQQIPEGQRYLVTSEGAFSYLCENYDLKELYVWPTNADAQGTPQQMRQVIDGVRENQIPVVFSESTVSDKMAKQVARETDARYGGVLYVDSLTEEDGPVPTFLDLLQFNADTIVNGFLDSE